MFRLTSRLRLEKKVKILESSRKVYLRNYLKVSELKVHLFVLLFNLGKYRRYVLLRLRALVLRIKGRGRGRVSPWVRRTQSAIRTRYAIFLARALDDE